MSIITNEISQWILDNNDFLTTKQMSAAIKEKFNIEIKHDTIRASLRRKGMKKQEAGIKYTKKEIDWAVKNAPNNTKKDLLEKFNKKFNSNRSAMSFNTMLYRHHIKAIDPCFRLNSEHIEFLKQNSDKRISEIAKIFNKKFNTNFTNNRIQKNMLIHKIKCKNSFIIKSDEKEAFLIECYNNNKSYKDTAKLWYEKYGEKFSQVSIKVYYNQLFSSGKLKKRNDRGIRIRAEKIAYPVGKIMFRKARDRGRPYYVIKVANPSVWRRLTNVKYEEYYNCKVDDTNFIVVQLDKNIENFEKSNLLLVNKKTLASYCAKYAKLEFKNILARKIAYNVIELNRRITCKLN